MEDVNFGPDESMDDDEIGEDEDAEMDFGEDTGSEDTSRTDDDDDMDEEVDEEVDVDDETGESEGAWQDEEDGADLVENGEGEGDEDGDEDDEDEEADDGVIWPEVCSPAYLYPLGNSVSHREPSKFQERQTRVMTKKASEVHPIHVEFSGCAEHINPGVPVILGEEEEEDEDEEWTSPQDGYVTGSRTLLILTLVP
jgi:hypothetical protein